MDKYEYKIRSDEIRSMIGDGRYAEAVKIADTIDWNRVKNVSMLCMISDLYKINRRYDESRDILLMAYERNPSGRAIVYSLCELAIKMGEFVQAVEYYKEFVRIAPRDDKRYILQYKLYEAQDVSLEERIAVLQEYKKHDYQEKWGYELAYLYHRVGLVTECVEECDDVFLWFGDGRYVMKALELKALHEPLTPEQQSRYERYKLSMGATAAQPPIQMPAQQVIQPAVAQPVGMQQNVQTMTAQQIIQQAVQPEPVYVQSEPALIQPEPMAAGQEPVAPIAQVQPVYMQPEPMAAEQEPAAPMDDMSSALLQTPTIPLGKGAAKALIQSAIMPVAQEPDADALFSPRREPVVTVDNAPTRRILEVEPTQELPSDAAYEAGTVAEQEPIAPVAQAPAGEQYTAAPVSMDTEDFFSPEGGFLVPTADVSNFNTVNLQRELAESMREVMGIEETQTAEPEPTQAFDPRQQPLPAQETEAAAPVFYDTADMEEPEPVAQEVFFADTADLAPGAVISPEPAPREQELGYVPFAPQDTPVGEEPQIKLSMAEQLKDKRLAASIAASTYEQSPLYSGAVYMDEPLQEEVPGAVIRPNLRYGNAQFEKLLTQEYDGQIRMALRDETVALEKQITGQISISDYMRDWEQFKKKQQEKQLASVRDRVMTETGDMLAEYDEETRKELSQLGGRPIAARSERLRDIEEVDELEIEDMGAPVERMELPRDEQDIEADYMEDVEQEPEPDYEPAEDEIEYDPAQDEQQVPFDTSELEHKAIQARLAQEVNSVIAQELETEAGDQVYEESLDALQTAIVTGNGAAADEADDAALLAEEEPAWESEAAEEQFTAEAQEPVTEVAADAEETNDAVIEASESEAEGSVAAEPELADTEDEPEATVSAVSQDTASIEAAVEEALAEETAQIEAAQTETEESVKSEGQTLTSEAEAPQAAVQAQPEAGAARLMTPEEKELFSPFINQKSSRDQIVRAIDRISMAAYTDNVIVTGEAGAGTVPLAKGLIRAAESSDANFSGKVAKIAASALNRREVSEVLGKLEGGALIVQSASDMKPETVNVLLKLLENENKGIIVVMEDTKSGMERLLAAHPQIQACFNVRVDIESLDNEALVSYAREYALEQEYSIDNLGVLALHTRIAENQRHDHAVTVAQVREFVDSAIGRAKRPSLRHFFDVLFGKRYDEEDMIILREKDFIYA